MTELCCIGCPYRYIVGPRDVNCEKHILPLDDNFPRCPYSERDGKRIWISKPTAIIHSEKGDDGKYQLDILLPDNMDTITYHCDGYRLSADGSIQTEIEYHDGAVVKLRSYPRQKFDRFIVKDGYIMPLDYYSETYSKKGV